MIAGWEGRSRLPWAGVVPSLLVGLNPAGGTGQEPPLDIARLSAPVVVDGVLDDTGWVNATSLPLTMYAPIFRGTPVQRTEIRVTYDDENLYAAGWFYDTDPDGIRVNSLYRDRWNGDDAFAIYIDAFNDNRTAKWFGTTPAGMRFDQLVSEDGATLNGSWDTFWDAETRVTAEGWFAEVRIPFSSLGFRADDVRQVVMGLTVTRLVSRTGERVTFPAIDPQFAFRQPSVARDIVLRDVRSTKPLYVTPYLLAGVNQTPELRPAVNRFGLAAEVSREVGLDVRYPVSEGLVVDVTANTDFAQVEADDQQINLDRFPLFFPEKRRFFQEGSGVFDFRTGGNNRLFHSRRIGLTASREAVPVLGGARVVGRIGDWDVGALNLTTRSSGSNPAENFGVARLRRGIINPYSTLGGMVTTRTGENGHNVSGGLDTDIRVVGDHYLTGSVALTASDDALDSEVRDRSVVYGRWQRRASRGLRYSADFTRIGPDYEPDLGFLARSDITAANLLANYFILTDDHPVFRRVWPGMLAFSTFRNADGVLESGQYAVWVQWETKSGAGGWVEPKVFRESVLTPFAIGGQVTVPAGAYTFADLQVAFNTSSGNRLRTEVDLRSGTYFDGTRTRIVVRPTWNLAPQVEVGADYGYNRLRFPDRDESVDIHQMRLRLRTAANARMSGNAFLQYNSTTRRFDVNVRFRHNIREGTDLWVVYNEGINGEWAEGPGTTAVPRIANRSFVVKYSHTFTR